MNQPIQNISERFPKTEKIDGKIYLMSAPCDEHIDVQANLIHIFMDYFKRNKKKCRARQDAKRSVGGVFAGIFSGIGYKIRRCIRYILILILILK